MEDHRSIDAAPDRRHRGRILLQHGRQVSGRRHIATRCHYLYASAGEFSEEFGSLLRRRSRARGHNQMPGTFVHHPSEDGLAYAPEAACDEV
jgi:hypothetical protein